MRTIRINELARELEVKPKVILELLPELGVAEKKTHSSSIDEDVAILVKRKLGVEVFEMPERGAEPAVDTESPAEPARAEAAALPDVEDAAAATAEPSEKDTAPVTETPERTAEPTSPGRPRPMPIRPPLAGQRVEPAAPMPSMPLRPATATAGAPPPLTPEAPPPAQPPPPKPGTVLSPRPIPSTTRPGQILTGPRQPLPPEAAPAGPGMPKPPVISRPPAPRPAAPQAPQQPAGQRPAAAQQQARPLAGQPAARPVVPPRPDLVAKLAQTQQPKVMPGQPQARPPMPGRPQSASPGQPIYRGPIRPNQPLMQHRGPGGPSGPGVRTARTGRPMHPTTPLPAPAPPPDQRRAPDKRRQVRQQAEQEEGRLRFAPRRQQQELAVNKDITISEGITVRELSEKMGIKAALVIKKLVEKKVFATLNQSLDVKLAEEIARDFGAATNKVSYEEEAVQDIELAEEAKDLVRRAPVVTIMGHVDHGKTSLLDAIRQTNVAEREAGGITQHIGASTVEKNGRKIVFIDTPGHEAFTRMRARGAKVTDIVILVVAADDGVMPQTLEAIDHAKAAEVPIIVAVNKIDKPDAQPERIKQQLADRGLLAEDWGGETVMVPVSAKTAQNLDLLLEMILLVADLEDLKGNPSRPGVGTVLEAKLDRGRGPVATVLVQNGTFSIGDFFICGAVFSKVRAMFDDRGNSIRSAEPSTPVEVLGLDSLPEVGDTFQVVTDTAKAKQIVMYRESKAREQAMSKGARITLDQLHDQLKEGEVKELNIILKADVGGTAEVLTDTLQKLSTEKVKVKVLHTGVGAITESDVLLATASNAIIVGFNVRPERNASTVAEQEKVDIRLHTIIYELTDEIKRAMTGMLEPVFKEIYRGRAEVREIFRISKVGTVAGCMVLDGTITRDSQVRLLRDNIVVHTGRLDSLKRFKNDASEVKAGFECGMALANFNDLKPADVIEAFAMERVAPEA